MPLHPTWEDIAVRLVLTVVASAIIGLDRGLRGHAAGLRTTILVGLAASVAMIQANLLLDVGGKTASSFGVMDLMRMPLGILTGVGFIGGGTILKRGNLVTGVTTAATLWAVTVIGLCMGGGQIWLGISATALSVVTLFALKWVDRHIPREHRAVVVTRAARHEPLAAFADALKGMGYRVRFLRQRQVEGAEGGVELRHEIRWKQAESAGPPVELITLLKQRFNLLAFDVTAEDG